MTTIKIGQSGLTGIRRIKRRSKEAKIRLNRRKADKRNRQRYKIKKVQRLRLDAFLQQGGKCYWCSVEMVYLHGAEYQNNPLMCTADRVNSRLGYTEDNVVAACKKCNNSRENKGDI